MTLENNASTRETAKTSSRAVAVLGSLHLDIMVHAPGPAQKGRNATRQRVDV